eukprot:jgi/Bigna1/76855/fgenesh1_pg.44_\
MVGEPTDGNKDVQLNSSAKNERPSMQTPIEQTKIARESIERSATNTSSSTSFHRSKSASMYKNGTNVPPRSPGQNLQSPPNNGYPTGNPVARNYPQVQLQKGPRRNMHERQNLLIRRPPFHPHHAPPPPQLMFNGHQNSGPGTHLGFYAAHPNLHQPPMQPFPPMFNYMGHPKQGIKGPYGNRVSPPPLIQGSSGGSGFIPTSLFGTDQKRGSPMPDFDTQPHDQLAWSLTNDSRDSKNEGSGIKEQQQGNERQRRPQVSGSQWQTRGIARGQLVSASSTSSAILKSTSPVNRRELLHSTKTPHQSDNAEESHNEGITSTETEKQEQQDSQHQGLAHKEKGEVRTERRGNDDEDVEYNDEDGGSKGVGAHGTYEGLPGPFYPSANRSFMPGPMMSPNYNMHGGGGMIPPQIQHVATSRLPGSIDNNNISDDGKSPSDSNNEVMIAQQNKQLAQPTRDGGSRIIKNRSQSSGDSTNPMMIMTMAGRDGRLEPMHQQRGASAAGVHPQHPPPHPPLPQPRHNHFHQPPHSSLSAIGGYFNEGGNFTRHQQSQQGGRQQGRGGREGQGPPPRRPLLSSPGMVKWSGGAPHPPYPPYPPFMAGTSSDFPAHPQRLPGGRRGNGAASNERKDGSGAIGSSDPSVVASANAADGRGVKGGGNPTIKDDAGTSDNTRTRRMIAVSGVPGEEIKMFGGPHQQQQHTPQHNQHSHHYQQPHTGIGYRERARASFKPTVTNTVSSHSAEDETTKLATDNENGDNYDGDTAKDGMDASQQQLGATIISGRQSETIDGTLEKQHQQQQSISNVSPKDNNITIEKQSDSCHIYGGDKGDEQNKSTQQQNSSTNEAIEGGANYKTEHYPQHVGIIETSKDLIGTEQQSDQAEHHQQQPPWSIKLSEEEQKRMLQEQFKELYSVPDIPPESSLDELPSHEGRVEESKQGDADHREGKKMTWEASSSSSSSSTTTSVALVGRRGRRKNSSRLQRLYLQSHESISDDGIQSKTRVIKENEPVVAVTTGKTATATTTCISPSSHLSTNGDPEAGGVRHRGAGRSVRGGRRRLRGRGVAPSPASAVPTSATRNSSTGNTKSSGRRGGGINSGSSSSSSSNSSSGSRGRGGGGVGIRRRRRGPMKSSLGVQIKKGVFATPTTVGNHDQDGNGAASGSSLSTTTPCPSSPNGKGADIGCRSTNGNRRRGPMVSSRGERMMLFMKAEASPPHPGSTAN